MRHLLSCEFNFDTVCVELRFSDDNMISIDTISVENEVADSIYQRSDLDYLIYNDPIAYADLIRSGNPEAYLKAVAVNKPFENESILPAGSVMLLRAHYWFSLLPN